MSMNPISMSEPHPADAPSAMRDGTARPRARPWYREPWPWILMAGPAIVVVASFVTLWLAVTTFDGLVEDDYYKQGLAINKTLDRDRVAASLKLHGEAALAPDRSRVQVDLAGDGLRGGEMLRLRVVHPSRPGLDQAVVLQRKGDVYEGNLDPLTAGRWTLSLEDEARSWRLIGQWRVPGETASHLDIVGEPRK
jgi:uncharacterized protein